MGSVGVLVTVGICLCLSQQLFIGVAQGHPAIDPLEPKERWNPLYYYDPLPQTNTKNNPRGNDLNPAMKQKADFAQLEDKPADDLGGMTFPEDAAIFYDKAYSLNKENSQGRLTENPAKPERVDYYGNVYPPVFKRPLDTVGSHFVKKENDMDEGMKRGLDHVGIGLIKKRPLDRLGHSLLKKDNHPPHEKIQPGSGFEGGPEMVQDRAAAVELIKKGLDVLGTGLIKRGDMENNPGPGLVEMKAGLDQLSTGLGTGDPSKEVDLDMVKKGLDRLGSGLMKREVDTDGIKLIKQGVDNIDDALKGNVTLKYVDNDGLGLLQKGLDNLATVMEKNELNVDGFNMISKGSLELASLIIQQEKDKAKHGYNQITDDEQPEYVKESDKDVLFESSKRSLDRLGSGLMKKRVVSDEEYGSEQDLHDKQMSKKSLDRLGSGLMKKSLDRLGSGLMKKSLDRLGSGLMKKSLDRLGSGLMKKSLDRLGSGLMKKSLDRLGSGLMKKSLDRLGSGLMKKSLDRLGSGLMKKSLDRLGSGLMKKSLDRLGSGLMKKSLDRLGSGLMKKRDNEDKSDSNREFQGKGHEIDDETDVDVGLLAKDWELTGDEASLMNKLQSLNYKLKNGFISEKDYLENEPAPDKKELNGKTKHRSDNPAFDKARANNMEMSKLESHPVFDQDKEDADYEEQLKENEYNQKDTKEERGYDVYVPYRKQGIDDEDFGPVILKKDLDYVGSGLIKKDELENEAGWKYADHKEKDWMMKENTDWMDGKLSPEEQDPQVENDDVDHKSQKWVQIEKKSKLAFKA